MNLHFKLFIALFIFLPGILLACLWDSRTLQEEIEINPDLFDLITGQFPSHSTAYYEARVKRLEPLIKKNPKNLEAKNDLAVAYIRLKQYKDAEKTLLELHKEKPGEYKYLSNLGVLYKKMEDFDKSIKYTNSALKISPEGHLGLGDWYVRMIKWRKNLKKLEGKAPTKNFLVWDYKRFNESSEDYSKRKEKEWAVWNQLEKENPEASKPQTKSLETFVELIDGNYDWPEVRSAYVKTQMEYLKKLIKADRHFSDAYVTLGDLQLRMKLHVFSPGSYESSNFALWAYLRAIELGHPAPEEINRRVDAIFNRMKELTKPEDSGYSQVTFEGRESTMKKIKEGMGKANAWVEHFHKVEAELVRGGKGDTVQIAEVEAILKERDILRYRPNGTVGLRQKIFLEIWMGHIASNYLLWSIPLLILYYIYSKVRSIFKKKAPA